MLKARKSKTKASSALCSLLARAHQGFHKRFSLALVPSDFLPDSDGALLKCDASEKLLRDVHLFLAQNSLGRKTTKIRRDAGAKYGD